MKKTIVLFVVNIENLRSLKYYTFLKKRLFLLFAVVLSIICNKNENEDEKIFEE